jgi:hypothetical protein
MFEEIIHFGGVALDEEVLVGGGTVGVMMFK